MFSTVICGAVSRKLQELRVIYDVSIEEVASDLGVSASTVKNIEAGLVAPDDEVLFYYANRFETTVGEILDLAPSSSRDIAVNSEINKVLRAYTTRQKEKILVALKAGAGLLELY